MRYPVRQVVQRLRPKLECLLEQRRLVVQAGRTEHDALERPRAHVHKTLRRRSILLIVIEETRIGVLEVLCAGGL